MDFTSKKIEVEKIIVNKSDEIALVVEKLIDSQAIEIVLNVPRFSKISESIANFNLIRREAQLLKKKVVIESVDDQVLEFAHLTKLESFNPLFLDRRKKISDIVADRVGRQRLQDEALHVDATATQLEELHSEKVNGSGEVRSPLPFQGQPSSKTSRLISFFGRHRIASGIVVVGGGLFLVLAFRVLPSADVTIFPKILPWNYTGIITVDSKLAQPDFEAGKLPGEKIVQPIKKDFLIAATGKKHLEQKAQGMLTIYNAYSSEPQTLVAKTRFVDPSGKVFRLVKGITVPGAKITDGKIAPLSAVARVEAEVAGSEYNIGPTNHFIIPGFKDTPKYAGFYAESKDAMSGGLIGDVVYATDSDVKSAHATVQDSLKKELLDSIQSQLSPNLAFLEESQLLNITKFTVSDVADAQNNVKISVEANIQIIVFNQQTIKDLLLGKMQKDLGNTYQFRQYNTELSKPVVAMGGGSLQFGVKADVTAQNDFSVEAVKALAANQKPEELRSKLFSAFNIEKLQISLWPFWVQTVPNRLGKIGVEIK